MSRSKQRLVIAALGLVAFAGCGETSKDSDSPGSGGSAESGGSASGGSSAAGANSGGANSGGAVAMGGAVATGGAAGCRPEILLLLDRSSSMQLPPGELGSAGPSKWEIVVPALDQALTDAGDSLGWGLKVFPTTNEPNCATNVSSSVEVPLVASAAVMSTAIHATMPTGDVTPTADAVNASVSYLASRTTDQPRYILLVTDGEPSCVGSLLSTDEARAAALGAVTSAADVGIHTFVVGIATTKQSAVTTLNQLAIAGLESRPGDNPLNTRFYEASTIAELTAALAAISQAAACP